MSGRGGWKLDPDLDGIDLHVRPRDDVIWHPLDPDCVCGPRATEARHTTTGRETTMYVHHSLDGRELREPTC
jgi:hypothetical protein